MAKLILLLIFVCFQFSKQEELTDIKFSNDELFNQKTPLTEEKGLASEMLDGEDENQWYREEDDDKPEENWTDDDEKWFQGINVEGALKGSDEEYDDGFEETEKLMDEIENWIEKSYPEKSKYQWLFELGKWFENDFNNDDDYDLYPDIKKKENLDVEVGDKDNINLYYTWLYKMKLRNSKTKRAQPFKRFWSV